MQLKLLHVAVAANVHRRDGLNGKTRLRNY